MEVDTKKCYQFPGVFTKACTQQLYYIADSSKLSQTCDDVHFMWKDTQLSKGQLNKKRLISADIAGKREIYYSSAPCFGVKVCLHNVIMLYLFVTNDPAQNTTYLCKGLVDSQLSLYVSIPKILMMKDELEG